MPDVFSTLPAGTVVTQHRLGITFTFSWESLDGLHIVRSDVRLGRDDEVDLAVIEKAVQEFTLIIALEVLNEFKARKGQ